MPSGLSFRRLIQYLQCNNHSHASFTDASGVSYTYYLDPARDFYLTSDIFGIRLRRIINKNASRENKVVFNSGDVLQFQNNFDVQQAARKGALRTNFNAKTSKTLKISKCPFNILSSKYRDNKIWRYFANLLENKQERFSTIFYGKYIILSINLEKEDFDFSSKLETFSKAYIIVDAEDSDPLHSIINILFDLTDIEIITIISDYEKTR